VGVTKLDERTAVTIVTGFLGSGKTTLLNRALRSPRLENAAVVINEFGSVPLDHLLSEASDDKIVVLENGCLCCTVFGDLVATLNRIYHDREAGRIPRFEQVLIETSGLADPRPVVQAFLSDPTLEGLYRLDSVVAIVDGANWPGTLQRHNESVHQVALADRILVSKLDLLGLEQASLRMAEVRQAIDSINPGVGIHRTDEPALDPAGLLLAAGYSLKRGSADALQWVNATAYHRDGASDSGDGGRHGRDLVSAAGHGRALHASASSIAAFCLERSEPTSLYGLELLLAAIEKNLGPALLRLKGLIYVKERPDQPAVIHGAQHLLHNIVWLDQWPTAERSTKIVFITDGMDRAELQDMISVLDRVARRTAAARERAQLQLQGDETTVEVMIASKF
jgi:G3E family GTPase